MAVNTASSIALDPMFDPAHAARPISRSSLDGPTGSWIGSDALVITVNPMNGTADDDFMFGVNQGPNHTINGNSDDDLVIGDMGVLDDTSGFFFNNLLAFSLDIDGTQLWSVDENPLFGNSSIPHATIYVEPTPFQTEFYSVTIGAGQTITVDIDYGNGAISGATDTVVELFDSAGTLIATNDDSFTANGGFGSTSTFDSFLTFTVGAAGTYFIRVSEFFEEDDVTFEGDETFLTSSVAPTRSRSTGRCSGSPSARFPRTAS